MTSESPPDKSTLYVHIYSYQYVYTVYTYTFTYICIHVHFCTYVYMYVHGNVYVHSYMYVYGVPVRNAPSASQQSRPNRSKIQEGQGVFPQGILDLASWSHADHNFQSVQSVSTRFNRDLNMEGSFKSFPGVVNLQPSMFGVLKLKTLKMMKTSASTLAPTEPQQHNLQ